MTSPPRTSQSGWNKTLHGSKAVFDKAWTGFERLGVPVNKLSNKIGSEAFWPQAMEKECDKAARILKSFCKDGFYKDGQGQAANVDATGAAIHRGGPKSKPKVLVKIPMKVIQKAVGIAVFTTVRTGLWVSGAGGSGVLIGRKADGTWSPPSGILIHTLGVGFLAGIDVYDCVLVINTYEALAKFSKLRVSLGGEISVVAGPVGAGGIIESDLGARRPLFSYMKSRGLYGGFQADGTILVERNDENARFYGGRVPVGEIMKGNVRRMPPETRMLLETVRDAEGTPSVDHTLLQNIYNQPPPSDIPIGNPSMPPTSDQIMQYGNNLSGAPGAQAYGPPPEVCYPPQQGYPPPQGGYDPYPPPQQCPAPQYGAEQFHSADPTGHIQQQQSGITSYAAPIEQHIAPPLQQQYGTGYPPPPPHEQSQFPSQQPQHGSHPQQSFPPPSTQSAEPHYAAPPPPHHY